MSMKRILLLLLLLFVCLVSFSQTINEINIVPRPVSIKKTNGVFLIDKRTPILSYVNDDNALTLNLYLKKLYGVTLPIKKTIEKNEKCIFFSQQHEESRAPNEGYGLVINKNKIEISSKTKSGAFYGIQTLLQLITP